MRHGEAGTAVSDRLRRLTPRGSQDVRLAAQQLRELCDKNSVLAPHSVLCSPWVRTRETAEQVTEVLGLDAPRALEALIPGAGTADVDGILARSDEGHLLIISHQPLVSRLVDHYTGDPGRVPGLTPGGFVTMATAVAAAGVAELLFWAMPPDFEANS